MATKKSTRSRERMSADTEQIMEFVNEQRTRIFQAQGIIESVATGLATTSKRGLRVSLLLWTPQASCLSGSHLRLIQ